MSGLEQRIRNAVHGQTQPTVTVLSSLLAVEDELGYIPKEALEEVANSFSGVEKSYALQAGREVRILVQPDSVGDTDAALLARDVVKKIEDNLVYPGQIKVIVIRETRNEEIAR